MEVLYQGVAEAAFRVTKAEAVVLIVLNGEHGTGYSIYGESGLRELLPPILRKIATQISQDKNSTA